MNSIGETYLFVAAAFQDMINPILNNTKPCMNAVEGSSGNTSKSIAAKGIADPELIWDRIILPEFGKRLARISPILPPNRPPIEVAIIKRVHSSAVVLWEKPISSNQREANDKADHGNEPETP